MSSQNENFFFDESLLQELSNNFLNSYSEQTANESNCSASSCGSISADESYLQFFNFNSQVIPSISCQCEGGFDLNNNSKVSRPRGAPFSIYVNDKLNVNISSQYLIQNNLNQSSITVSLKTYLFEEVSALDSLEEYIINLDQATLINDQLQVTLPIRRDNTTRRKTRKNTAKTIKGEVTAEDLEKKKKMRRSLNQEATKKVSYIQIIANQQVLATSQNMWCRSKTRSEMDKKKERRDTAKKTCAPKKRNTSTKRKQSELVPLELDQQMIDTHLNSAKRVKQSVAIVEQPQQISYEEIPEEMIQMLPNNWQEMCGVTSVDGVKQLQTITSNDNLFSTFLEENQESNTEDFSFMFQEAFPSPTSGAVMPAMGINLDNEDWSSLFEQLTNTVVQQVPRDMMLSKPICLDDMDFDSFLTEQEINL